ncbi:MinD/ParA family protein [Thermodesulfobacteriota bacterium]
MDQAAGLRGLIKDNNQVHRNITPKTDRMERKIRVITVTSGKGGVGKSSVTANLAQALQVLGKQVLILDADLGLANMDIMLGLNPRFTISHVLKGEKCLEDVIITAPGGFKLLPAASGIQELTELDNSQRLFLLNELDALHNQFDFILIDTGAGISSNVMYFNYAAMERIVIVTNEPTSLTDAYALIKILTSEHHQKKFKVLVNSARNADEASQIFRNLSMVADRYLGSPSLDYLGWIPYDKLVSKAVRKQKTVLKMHPETKASKSFMSLAEKMVASIDETVFDGDIKFFWRDLLDA